MNEEVKAAPDAEEETYEIGKRDGYASAVQDIDLLTGGDGEYRYCMGVHDERHCPDPATMKERIVERFNACTPASCSPDVVELVAWLRRYSPGPSSRINEAADALESMMRREDAMRSALESIAQHDVGLQALIEDGKDTPKNVASYYASQVERRRKIARAVLEGAPVKEGN